MGHKLSLFTLTVIVFGMLAASATAATDFSGVWAINASKSSTGEFPPPDAYTRTIEQDNSNIKITTKQTNMMGESTTESTCPVAGGECKVTAQMGEIKSVASWEGDVFVTNNTMDFQGMSLKSVEKMSLSGDGKVITINATFSSDMGDMEFTYVLDKK